jgi:hypothetical protein
VGGSWLAAGGRPQEQAVEPSARAAT